VKSVAVWAWVAVTATAPPAAPAAGDASKGAPLLYEARCGGCHSVDVHRVGPAHRGVFGRKAGSAPGFNYSAALRKAAVVWDEKSLDAWLAGPETLIPGQAMGFSVDDATVRRDIVAYLRTLMNR
jgi:cytochrome c